MAALGVTLGASGSAACSCSYETSAELLEGADVVFRGRVSDVSPDDRDRAYTFRVITTYKGASVLGLDPLVVVHTSGAGNSCGASFQTGGDYLVYAAVRYVSTLVDPTGIQFVTGECFGNRPYSPDLEPGKSTGPEPPSCKDRELGLVAAGMDPETVRDVMCAPDSLRIIGDEVHWMYPKGTVVFEHERVRETIVKDAADPPAP